MKRIGYIYIIKNIKNNKIYIGQTALNPMKRWQQHYYECLKGNNLYLYNEMRKYGIENFVFQILESNIEISLLDEKEIYYIKKYNSNNKEHGYNLTMGGQTSKYSKLTEIEVKEIISLLKTNIEIKNIAEKYNISESAISDINCGDSWKFENIKYPIRKSFNIKKNFTEEDINKIEEMLINKVPFVEIANIFNVSITTISNINNGTIYRKENKQYPLNSNKYSHLTLKEIKNIIYLLINTTKNYNEIATETGKGRKTISGINNGLLYKDILKELNYTIYPIRQHYKP